MKNTQPQLSLRRSASGDELELGRLWHTVFGDSKAFIDTFFRTLYAPGLACLAFSGDRLACAGYCLPGVAALGKTCAYIYAVATYPEYRGMGAAAMVVRDLTQHAFDSGVDIVATLPASDSLTGWYEKVLNMTPVFKKGRPGAVFPDSWRRFADYCGSADSGAPKYLWAVGAPGVDLAPFKETGWQLTFE